jgi:SAM-dependent methyltransferase
MQPAVKLSTDSLERLVPGSLAADDATGEATLALHLERYEFAARYLRPGRTLDIACGVGYGSRLLADRRADVQVVGVDLSADAVAYGRETYGGDRVELVVSDAMRFTDAIGFDSIVSLETIEHMPDAVGFVAHVLGLLRPGGVFVGSVPTTPSVDANPHHFHDFTERGFRRLVESHGLSAIAAFHQTQPFSPAAVLTRSEARTRNVRRDLPRFYATNPSKLARRVWSTVRWGFVNRYVTIAWERPR